MRKQLIILSGFLGSGKTTLLHTLVSQNTTCKMAILLNDFGDIPVDGVLLRQAGLAEDMMVVEIGGGSVFCACLKEHFVKALYALAERDEDVVMVEASGMSDPASITKMLQLSGLDAVYEHNCTLCLFDPLKSLKLAHVLEVIPRQLASASVVILTKCDARTPEERGAARAYIQSVAPQVPVVESFHGNIAMSTLPKRAVPAMFFGFNTPENRPDSFIIQKTHKKISLLRDSLAKNPHVLRTKGGIQAADGVFMVSDTGRGFEITPCAEAAVPLTVICMQGSGRDVVASLQADDLVSALD